jgi:hypothetical protein
MNDTNWKDKMLDERNTSQGAIKTEIFGRYYDEFNSIIVAGPANPNNADDAVYNIEAVHDHIQRNAPRLYVGNPEQIGGDTLYVLVSHGGGQTFSPERPIPMGLFKVYYNVYELRLRSTTIGQTYFATEYELGLL